MKPAAAPRVVIIGAGPAGLSAGYRLACHNVPAVILEAHPSQVGGIAKTVQHRGFRIDIGGHRFFTKSRTVDDFWSEILGQDLLVRSRASSILYRGKRFAYPLRAEEVLWNLGGWETLRCLLSYCRRRVSPRSEPESFEQWVSDQFGPRLYEIFFKTYTEKVWGVPGSSISADWAAQRINRLSLFEVVRQSLLPRSVARRKEDLVKTLIRSFRYPRRGPGMLWEACADRIERMGGQVRLGTRAVRLDFEEGLWKVLVADREGRQETLTCTDVISSAPLGDVVSMIVPPLSQQTREAAGRLRYRHFLVVALMLKEKGLIADQWIYVHDPGVAVGRIQNYKAWSPEMVPDGSLCCYGMEYFCSEGDEVWGRSDAELVELATRELCQVLPVTAAEVVDGCVVRQKNAYPVYDEEYKSRLELIRRELEERVRGLHLVGRNGMHRYNNQDHSVLTAFLTVENILAGEALYDVWKVNQDAEYVESQAAPEEPWRELRMPLAVGSRPDALRGYGS